jgi:hypothetical protein
MRWRWSSRSLRSVGRTEAEEVGREPLVADGLIDQHEVLDGVLARADASGRLHPDAPAGRALEVANRLEHDERHRRGGGRRDLARGRLDEVGPGEHGEPRCSTDVVEGAELTRLQDHLEVGGAACLLDRDDLVVDEREVTGEECSSVDDHVDLVGTGRDGVARVHELDVETGTTGREGRRDCGNVDAVAHDLARGRHQVAVDAHGRHAGHRGVGGVRPQGLRAHRADLPAGVHALEGREVHHADRQVDGPRLGVVLDRARAEGCDSRVRADLVDPGQSVQEPAQRARTGIGQAQLEGRGRHPPTLATARRRQPWRAAPSRPGLERR